MDTFLNKFYQAQMQTTLMYLLTCVILTFAMSTLIPNLLFFYVHSLLLVLSHHEAFILS